MIRFCRLNASIYRQGFVAYSPQKQLSGMVRLASHSMAAARVASHNTYVPRQGYRCVEGTTRTAVIGNLGSLTRHTILHCIPHAPTSTLYCGTWALDSTAEYNPSTVSVLLAGTTPLAQQHTKNCASCLGALKRIKYCIRVAQASAVASLAWVSKYCVHLGRG